MAKRPVIIQMRSEPRFEAPGTAAEMDMDMVPDIALGTLELDPDYPPVPIPEIVEPPRFTAEAGRAESRAEPVFGSYIVRGVMEEEEMDAAASRDDVVGVFTDLAIEPMLTCDSSSPVGNLAYIEQLLCTSRLHEMGADGLGVMVAIVDNGVNLADLQRRGKNPAFDPPRSWSPVAGMTPGAMPVDHGTMCAFDVCIAAPRCTILDIALTQPRVGLPARLSDAVRAYNHLANIMRAPRRPGEIASLVVNNSWGVHATFNDFAVDDPRNYYGNARHPFNLIVATLESLGADIVFAAGNCGRECADFRCDLTPQGILGANSHDKALCVAGVDATKQRVGYSSRGPGRLTRNKPDLCGYTHFTGSQVSGADGGTSAAAAVVTGMVAAYRTLVPYQPDNPSASPEAVRNFFRSTCEDLGGQGFDFDHGYGVVNGCAIAESLRLKRPPPLNLCALIPRLCGPLRVPIDIVRRFPQLRALPAGIALPPLRSAGGVSGFAVEGAGDAVLDLGPRGEALETLSRDALAELIYRLGYEAGLQGQAAAPPPSAPAKRAGHCGCGGD